MNTSWWRSLDELDADQKAFILLPAHGKHLLVGPPGSGKTNLLLLRAQYLAGQGDKNVLILTYTNALKNFIQSGIGGRGLIESSQIRTYHSWAYEHVLQYLKVRAMSKGMEFDDVVRTQILEKVIEANKLVPTQNLYSAIFVDEAQDLTMGELDALLSLSEKVCICGDGRQGIYQRDGLNIGLKLGLEHHTLKRHFRIGHKIARAADRLMPPARGTPSLEETSNYNPKIQGESSVKMHSCSSRDEQFVEMLELIRVQLDAFNQDTIGIFCGKNESLQELRQRFDGTDLQDAIYVHGVDKEANFKDARRIHALTIHNSKGTEFRAVHLYGIEELAYGHLKSTKLAYTAITRAKTSLHAYRTGPTSPQLENAFAEPSHFELEDLFGSGDEL